ncbi:hypothetical protein ACJJTC_012145 [Scirpophaga incertulas]
MSSGRSRARRTETRLAAHFRRSSAAPAPVSSCCLLDLHVSPSPHPLDQLDLQTDRLIDIPIVLIAQWRERPPYRRETLVRVPVKTVDVGKPSVNSKESFSLISHSTALPEGVSIEST